MNDINLTNEEISDAFHNSQRENELLKSPYDKDITKQRLVEKKLMKPS